MSAKADLTPACRALRPAVSQTLRQSASAGKQLHLAFSRGPPSKKYNKKKGHHVAVKACHQDPVTTGRDHLHAGAKGRVTRLRTLGHTAGSAGLPGE